MKKRIFLGIPVQKSQKQILGRYKNLYPNSEIRWVKEEDFHITVSFLGYIEEKDIPKLELIIENVLQPLPSFILEFKKISFAPPKSTPRMIWAEFFENDSFTELVHTVEKNLAQHIEISDYRNGHSPIPHITLARFDKADVAEKISFTQPEISGIKISSCFLFESHLNPKGPKYTPIKNFALKRIDSLNI